MRAPRIVFTAGIFDLLHCGHLSLLWRSRDMGDILVVGVVSDDGAAAYKRRPVQDEQTRLRIIRDLRMVDFAVLQPTTDPTPVLEIIRPEIMTHGDDWTELREGKQTLLRMGIRWVTIPYGDGGGTTGIIERIRNPQPA